MSLIFSYVSFESGISFVNIEKNSSFWDLSRTCQIFSWIWKVQPLKSTHGTSLCPIEFLRHSFHSPFKLFWPPSNVVPQDPGNNCVPWMVTPWNFPQMSLCSCLLVFSCFPEGKKTNIVENWIHSYYLGWTRDKKKGTVAENTKQLKYYC